MKAFKFRFELKVIDKQQIFQRSRERNGEGAGEAGSGDKKKGEKPPVLTVGKKSRTVVHTLLSTQSSACKFRSNAALKLNVNGHFQTAQLRGK